MDNLKTDTYWYRRLSHLAIGLSVFTVLFFAYSRFLSGDTLDASLTVGVVPALLAGVTLVLGVFSLLPISERLQSVLPPVTQALLLLSVAALIYTTGGLYSPLLAMWIPAVLFAGAFGLPGLVLAAIVPLTYSVWLSLTSMLTFTTGLTALVVGAIPLVVSYLLFSRHTESTQAPESPYGDVSMRLNRISDKAEIVINAITNGVIALDRDGIIQLINPAAQRLIGWESSDALRLDYKSVLRLEDEHSNEVTPATDPILQVLTTNEEVRTEELRLITRSGKKMDISLVASPVGQPGSGAIIVFADITKEKKEERDQAEFISTASHEMRTPVASIEGYLGLALNPATAQIDDKARLYISKAQEVAQHLGRLFQDLLDITKAEDGRLSNNPRAVEVVSFVKDVVEGLRPQAESKGLILVYKPVPEDISDDKTDRRLYPVYYANVDNDHLREIVANLIENAIKYTKQGTVSVDITGDEKQIQISVQDTGIGIPAEDLPHLFQKFYRVDNSDTREIGGTGLGLYLTRRLAEAMDGRVWAESQQGIGSTFYLSIPRISHQEAMHLIETLDEEPNLPEISPAVSGLQVPAPENPGIPPTASIPTPQPAIPSTPPMPSPAMPPQPQPNPQFQPQPAPVAPSGPQSPFGATPMQQPTPQPNQPQTPQPTPAGAAPAPPPEIFAASGGVFVSPPPEVIASQLANSVRPQPAQAQHPQQQPPAAQPGGPTLASIEQNPHPYLRRPVNAKNENQT